MVVREPGNNKNILEKDIVYKERSFKIRNLPDPNNANYEICVLARDSMGNVKHFRNSQCRLLDKHNFSSSSIKLSISAMFTFIPIVSVGLW
jgi:hypothetical protein